VLIGGLVGARWNGEQCGSPWWAKEFRDAIFFSDVFGNKELKGKLGADKRWRSLVSAGQSWATLANFTQKCSDADSVRTLNVAPESSGKRWSALARERGRVLGWRLTSM